MSGELNHFYDFGPYRLDTVKRLLLKEGEPVSLTPKAFDTLVALVQGGGQLIEKEELMKRVWPDSFVEDGNLTVNISMLRKVLGESPNQHRYIVTVPGRGYRFVASVREIFDDSAELIVEEHTRSHVVIEGEEGASAEQETGLDRELRPAPVAGSVPALSRLRANWKLAVVAILLTCLVTGGFALEYFTRPTDWRALLQTNRVAGLKSDRQESMNSGRLSPDSSMIVFSASGEGLNIWIKQIDGGQPFQITRGPSHDDSPIWSNDQQRIAFMSDRDNQIGIWTVPFLGGIPPTPLKTLEATPSLLKGGTSLIHWSKDTKTIYYSWNNNVYALDVDSKDTTQLTNFDPKTPFGMEFRISADEEWIAYIDRVAGKDGQFDIWRVPTRGGSPVQVTNDAAIEQRPVWHPDGKRIIYTSRVEGRTRLCVAYVDGSTPELITFTEEENYVWDVSASGDKLLFYGKRDESDLWRVNIDTKDEAQLTSDISLEFWPQVSPDGKSIAFQMTRGERIVWEPRRSSLFAWAESPAGQPVELAAKAFDAQWSPDGDRLAFLRDTNTVSNLFTIKAAGGQEKQLTTEGVFFGGSTVGPPFNRFCTRNYCWSPDASRIAYCSKKGGAPNLWVVSADGSGETQVTNNTDPELNFNCPVWSPNDNRLAYVTYTSEPPGGGKQEWHLCVTDLEKSETVFQTDLILRLVGWTSAGDDLVIAMVENSGMKPAFPAQVTLSRVSVAGHDRRDLARVDSVYFSNIHLSPDRRNVSYVAAYEGRDNIWVLPVDAGAARKVTGNTDSKAYYSGLAWSPDGKHIYYGKQASWSLITMINKFM